MLPLSSPPIFPTNNKTHKTIFKDTLLEKSRCEFSNIFKYTLLEKSVPYSAYSALLCLLCPLCPTLPYSAYSAGGVLGLRLSCSARPPAIAIRHLCLPSPSASCLSPPAVSARRRRPPTVCTWFRCPPSPPCGVCTEFDAEGWMQSLAHDCHPSIW